MKRILSLLTLSLLFFTSCNDDDVSPRPACYVQGSTIELADGTVATLSRIVDRRCPCDVICFWAGYVALELTIGNDTILHLDDIGGREYIIDSTDFNSPYHFTARGDEFEVISYGDPEDSCAGRVASEDFCLQIEVIR